MWLIDLINEHENVKLIRDGKLTTSDSADDDPVNGNELILTLANTRGER